MSPPGVTQGTVEFPHGRDKFVIPDAATIRPGHGAKLDAIVNGLQCFHQFGAA